jgi:hypothetical protein
VTTVSRGPSCPLPQDAGAAVPEHDAQVHSAPNRIRTLKPERFRALCLAPMLVVLHGCASTSVVAPDSLAMPSTDTCLVISGTPAYSQSRGMVGATFREGLEAGVYRAERADEQGVYFRGEGRPVWQSNSAVSDRYAIGPGGVWVPRDSRLKPRLYVYIAAEPDQAGGFASDFQDRQIAGGADAGASVAGAAIGGAIVRAIVAADAGKIMLHPPIDDIAFRQAVSAAVLAAGPCSDAGTL